MFDEGEERGARVSKKGKKASLEDGEPPRLPRVRLNSRRQGQRDGRGPSDWAHPGRYGRRARRGREHRVGTSVSW
jgi:hypothetical protein